LSALNEIGARAARIRPESPFTDTSYSDLMTLAQKDVPKLLEALQWTLDTAAEAEEVWKDQVGTHYVGCHTHHVGCLAALIRELVAQTLESDTSNV
jgi:hypothetical protein